MTKMRFQQIARKGLERCNASGASSLETGNRKPPGPQIAALARRLLADATVGSATREERAFRLLLDSIEERGGRLEVVARNRMKLVQGEVRVPAGHETTSRLVRAGSETMTVSCKKGLDEQVVNAVTGFGMGALEVSLRVDKDGNAEYVIRTNGGFACREENKVNVAMALAGAAQIVEEMVKPQKEADVVLLEQAKAA